MGKQVLSTASSGEKLRAYAHCSKQSQGFALLLLNFDGGAAGVQVSLSTESGSITSQSKNEGHSSKLGEKTRRWSLKGVTPTIKGGNTMKEEYHLTAQKGDLHSQTVLLNGKVLSVGSDGEIPTLDPAMLNLLDPVSIAPYSVVFIHIPSIVLPACE
ncbi:hypothetical protein Dimus_019384 [Dionaea muscipula]